MYVCIYVCMHVSMYVSMYKITNNRRAIQTTIGS